MLQFHGSTPELSSYIREVKASPNPNRKLLIYLEALAEYKSALITYGFTRDAKKLEALGERATRACIEYNNELKGAN